MLKKLLMLGAVMAINGCAATVIGAGAGAAVATGTDARGGGSVIDDQLLEHKVNSVLDAQVPNGSFTVASYNSEVLLAGQVSSKKEYSKADNAVANTDGVKKVMNHLIIGKKESLGDISKDAYITSAAKTRLIAQKEVNTNNIKVVTCAGVVYLLGKDAGSKVQINGAIRGIRDISGVKGVVDLIKF